MKFSAYRGLLWAVSVLVFIGAGMALHDFAGFLAAAFPHDVAGREAITLVIDIVVASVALLILGFGALRLFVEPVKTATAKPHSKRS